MRGRRHRRGHARPARRSTRPASPTSSSRWPRPGSTRAPSRCRSPRPPTTRWAGSRSTSTGAPRCPASTPSASAPAPACTAPTGSPPTRSASASSSADALPRRRCEETADDSAPPPTRVALRAADRGDPRRGLAPRRPAAPRPSSSRELLADPYPLAARDRRLRAGAPRVARRAPARRLPRTLDHELDGIHLVLGPDGEIRREDWR